MTETHEVAPAALTLGALRRFERPQIAVSLSDAARANIRRSHDLLADLLGRGERIYGVNSGFGPLSNQILDAASLQDLQHRLVLSNAAGVGEPLAPHIVRRVMLLKLATLAAGASGVREELANALLDMLNADVVPVMPCKGSAGASGDLAPLAHLGAALIGVGEVFHQGVRCSAAEAFRRLGREPPDQPLHIRGETARYTDPMPGGRWRQFSMEMACKSVITNPSGGMRLQSPGLYEIQGFAWSGNGTITHVDVTLDGGRNWTEAVLEEPVLEKCLTRFRYRWQWSGEVASRAVDSTGYVQPTAEQLASVREIVGFVQHNNAMFPWTVDANGEVGNAIA